MEKLGGVSEFLEKLKDDKGLQDKLKKMINPERMMMWIARDEGYTFTAEDLDKALRERWGILPGSEVLGRVTFSEAPGH